MTMKVDFTGLQTTASICQPGWYGKGELDKCSIIREVAEVFFSVCFIHLDNQLNKTCSNSPNDKMILYCLNVVLMLWGESPDHLIIFL